ncbi:TNF receptor-associated factor 4-like [Branchiostoma lanceolatum]|uniref:TNF receptor-associated factor 4-like n=1 Tax=Branchiostoma lanceolatum TaxID=7740 RepID=UPI0034517711
MAMGIEPELFVTDSESQKQIIEALLCALCNFVVRDAVICPARRGHQFCRTCISQWLKCSPTCPMDRSPLRLSQLNTARNLNRAVQEAQVKCTNGTEDSKCDWTGPYGNLEGHNKCCLLKEVKCCNFMFYVFFK